MTPRLPRISAARSRLSPPSFAGASRCADPERQDSGCQALLLAEKPQEDVLRGYPVSWLGVLTVALILAGVLVLAGVVVLWRSTPSKSERPEPPEDDRTKNVVVDVMPGGFGGGGGT